MSDVSQLSQEKLAKALKISSQVVALFGNEYLVIFIRLHEELEKFKAAEDKTTLALALARSYADCE